MAYFDDLVPDYTMEVPAASAPSLEALRRLMYMFKLAVNGVAVSLDSKSEGIVAISPEFEEQFGWTLEEFQALEAGDFFHEDSSEIAAIHRANNLAAPYIARCYNKDEQSAYFQVQGLCVEFDGEHFRMLSFELIT
jgi:PAS domain-containing protein